MHLALHPPASNRVVMMMHYFSEGIEKRVSFVANLERIQEIQDNIVWPTLLENEKNSYIPEVDIFWFIVHPSHFALFHFTTDVSMTP